MPLIPNTIENLIFVQLGQAPSATLDVFAGMSFRALHAAIQLGVLEGLNNQPSTAAQLAQRLGTHPDGTRFLLEALTGLHYLKRSGETYRLTTNASKWLVSSAEINLAPYVLYWGAILPMLFSNLEESIRTGQSPCNLYDWIETQPQVSSHFQEGMIALAKLITKPFLNAVKFSPQTKRILDIGGGHGTYSAAFCERNLHLTATILDSPQALATARTNPRLQALGQRIKLQEGNFMTEDLGNGFDAALIINIVHGFDPAFNVELLRKTAHALNKGGEVVIVEQLEGKAPLPLANTINSLLGLAYHHLLGGRMYRYEEVVDWLAQAGFGNIKLQVLRTVGSSIIRATKAT